MEKLYVLIETRTFYSEIDGIPVAKEEDIDHDIDGVFDDMSKLRELANKIIERCKCIVGPENVTRESFTDIWYKTIDGKTAHLELTFVCGKMNTEWPDFLNSNE